MLLVTEMEKYKLEKFEKSFDKTRQLIWYGHVQRIAKDLLPKTNHDMDTIRKKKRGSWREINEKQILDEYVPEFTTGKNGG